MFGTRRAGEKFPQDRRGRFRLVCVELTLGLIQRRLGVCRGSGVLRREGGAWKVVQYNLSVPIPNELVEKFAAEIKGPKKR